jgi:predicted lipoprotein with Yx(FWY)xxD motif
MTLREAVKLAADNDGHMSLSINEDGGKFWGVLGVPIVAYDEHGFTYDKVGHEVTVRWEQVGRWQLLMSISGEGELADSVL